jgi:hypothetical protein
MSAPDNAQQRSIADQGGVAQTQTPTSADPPGGDVVQVKLNLSLDAFETIQRLAETHQMTVTEAIHRAIAALAYFWDNEGKVMVERGPGRPLGKVSFTR